MSVFQLDGLYISEGTVPVSTTLPDLPRPHKVESIKENWYAETEWEDWGACSVCGRTGTRRRYGECVIKQLHADKQMPETLRMAMESWNGRIPCRNTIFKDSEKYSDLIIFRSEIGVGTCATHTCGNQKPSTIRPIFITAAFSVEEESHEKSEVLSKRMEYSTVDLVEGVKTRMRCPGDNGKDSVAWKRKVGLASYSAMGEPSANITELNSLTTTLSPTATLSRVRIHHATNELVFDPITVEDSGVYRCFQKELLLGHITVTVSESRVWVGYNAYIRERYKLTIIFGVYFIILVVILWKKHQLETLRFGGGAGWTFGYRKEQPFESLDTDSQTSSSSHS